MNNTMTGQATYSMTLSFDTYLQCRVALIHSVRDMFKARRNAEPHYRSYFCQRAKEYIAAYRELERWAK